MRKTSSEGIALIKHFEGFSPVPYEDAAGLLTIGYGHLIKQDEHFTLIQHEQAEALLREDVREAERAVCRLITAPLADSQFDALVSFTFNLGGGALQRSTLRRKVNRGENAAVPDEFMKWVWAGGRRLEGLKRRRSAEVSHYIAAISYAPNA